MHQNCFVKPHIILFTLLLSSFWGLAQQKDSISVVEATVDTYENRQQNVFEWNAFINTQSPQAENKVWVKTKTNFSVSIFYLLAGILLAMGIIRTLFARYFSILFKVFFNASLRQSQLTDQLLIAKLPSLIFNIFFTITSGLYVYFLLIYFNDLPQNSHIWSNICLLIALVATIYLIKYLTLKFTGWISGYKQETNTYIFVVFLINKIVGILLVPFIIVMAFSDKKLVYIVISISAIVLILLLLLRFIRSYSLLKHNLKVSPYHFLLYIIGIEFLPLLLIHKALLIFFIKKS